MLKDAGVDDEARKLLADCLRINREVARRRRNIDIIRKKCEGSVSCEENEILLLQSACTHPSNTRYPDASGGNASSTKCDVCGAEGRGAGNA